jgi:LacI family transcriptional regulator
MADLTLEDLARQAGVSRSTVSRVVNNHPNVRARGSQTLAGVIQATGFTPTWLRAHWLPIVRGCWTVIPRSVSTFFADPYIPRMTQGVAQACNAYGFTLALLSCHHQRG